MTRLDEVVVKDQASEAGQSEPRISKTIDDVLKEEDTSLVQEAKRSRLEEIVANRKKRTAEAKRDTTRLEEGLPGANVSVSGNTSAAILKMLVDSGMDGTKASQFIKELDQESLAKIAIMSGGNRGSDFLLPLILAGKNQGTTAKELAEIGRSYIDVAQEAMQNAGSGPTATELVTLMVTLNDKMRPPAPDNSAVTALSAKVDAQNAQVLNLMNEMNKERVDHQKELALVRENELKSQIANVQAQVANYQNRDPFKELETYKNTLEKFGFKVGTGGADDIDRTSKIVDTIMKAPA